MKISQKKRFIYNELLRPLTIFPKTKIDFYTYWKLTIGKLKLAVDWSGPNAYVTVLSFNVLISDVWSGERSLIDPGTEISVFSSNTGALDCSVKVLIIINNMHIRTHLQTNNICLYLNFCTSKLLPRYS